MSSFRPVAQGFVDAEIVLMEWNPTKDLIALTTVTGKVLLYRQSWQLIWEGVKYILSQNTQEKTIHPTALAWRPDGEILACAFDNGQILLCDIEDGNVLHLVVRAWCPCTSLNWVQCMEKQTVQQIDSDSEPSADYVPNYFPYSAKESSNLVIEEAYKKLLGQKVLNILASGLQDGTVFLHSYGIYQLGSIYISLKTSDPIKCKVVSVTVFRDLRVLTVVLERQDRENNCEYFYRSYFLSRISDYMDDIESVSLKYTQLTILYISLNSSIRKMKEYWEDIQTKMDLKFHKYIQHKDDEDTSIKEDFSEMLMFGTPSDALQKYFLDDLKEDDIENFLFSIETSYSEMENFVVRRLQMYGSVLFFHLYEVKGKSIWKVLSTLLVEELAIHTAINSVGSLLLKTVEFLKIAQDSFNNMKAFLRWLHAMLLRISKKPIPGEALSAAQQNIPFMEEFFKYNFHTKYDGKKRKTTVMFERFGQYLKAEDLLHPIKQDPYGKNIFNPYGKLLENHPYISETEYIFQHYDKKSLIGLDSELHGALDSALNCREELLGETDLLYAFNLLTLDKNRSPPRISHFSCSETSCTYIAFTDHLPPSSQFIFIRHSTIPEAVMINFSIAQDQPSTTTTVSDKNKSYKVLDVKFFDKYIMVLLLENQESETICSILLKIPLDNLLPELVPLFPIPDEPVRKMQVLDGLNFMATNCFKRLEKIKASQMAVSASRKVVCVFSATQGQIYIFEVGRSEEY